MKLKIKKLLSALLALSLGLGSLSACGRESSETPQKQEKVYSEDQIVTIKYSLWGGDARLAITEEVIKDFEKKYPGIRVELDYGTWNGFQDKMDEEISSGTEADVMQLNYSWLDRYSENGDGFADLYGLADYIDLSYFTDADLSYGVIDGKLNALPTSINSAVPLYNSEMLAEYGFELPTTWEELYEIGSVLRRDDRYVFALDKWQLISIIFTYLEQVTGKSCLGADGKIEISRMDMTKLKRFYTLLFANNVFTLIDDDNEEEVLSTGKAMGTICWINSIEKYKGYIEEGNGTVILGEFLTEEKSTRFGYYAKPATMYAISKNCEHPAEAATFVNYLLNNRDAALLQKTDKGVPVSSSAEMALMETGELNNFTYYGTVLMNYNLSKLKAKPGELEDSDYVDDFLSRVSGGLLGE